MNNSLLENVRHLIAQGNRIEALNQVQHVLRLDPTNVEVLYLYAQLSTDTPAAINALQRLLQLQPGHVEALLLLERLQMPTLPPIPNDSASMQQMLMQQHLLMQQQLVNQQQLAQQQMMNQQFAPQPLVLPVVPSTRITALNNSAFRIGLLCGFFGVFGIAHMMNQQTRTGIVILFLGFCWDSLLAWAASSPDSTILLACLLLPLHLVFGYLTATSGARVAVG